MVILDFEGGAALQAVSEAAILDFAGGAAAGIAGGEGMPPAPLG